MLEGIFKFWRLPEANTFDIKRHWCIMIYCLCACSRHAIFKTYNCAVTCIYPHVQYIVHASTDCSLVVPCANTQGGSVETSPGAKV